MNTMCRQIRVLIVDDHPLYRHGLSQLLQSNDSIDVVAEAVNAWEGLKLADDLQPDIVLMDYQMPGMNGAEATAALCDRLPELAVIGMSNDDRRDIRDDMLAAGADDFLLKGATLEELLESIYAALG